MKANSTRRRSHGKATRKSKNALLWIHSGSGRWAKKHQSRTLYFQKVSDDRKGQESEREWLIIKDGGSPKARDEAVTLRDCINAFLTYKSEMVATGELTQRSHDEYHRVCKSVIEEFGKEKSVSELTARDFENLRARFAKTNGPVRLGKMIQVVRMLFKYAYEAGIIDKPMRYGTGFKRPSRSTLRRHRSAKGERLFSRDEIKTLLAHAKPQMRAMILLGINCGLGNSDCARLTFKHLDLTLDNDWGVLNFPREKTGIKRRSMIWPQTRKALEQVINARSKPRDFKYENHIFITKYRGVWFKESGDNQVSSEFAKLAKKCGITLTFYALRHSFRTIADETKDFPAIDLCMGHTNESMATVYREKISDQRLQDVATYVRNWLFADVSKDPVDGDDESTDDPSPAPSEKKDTREADDDDGPKLRIYVG